MRLSKHHRFFLLFLVLFSLWANAQRKNKDPFARSARLPDLSIGLSFQQNTKVKFKVPGGSIGINSTYYNFDYRFLVGLDFMINIQQRQTAVFPDIDSATLDAESTFYQLVYNHNVYGLRGGWMLTDQLFLLLGVSLASMEQFDELRSREGSTLPTSFYQATGDNKLLFQSKYGIQYKHRYLIYEFFYSKRGLGLGINYFFNG
ncbi:MAG: hypothetical protein ACPG8F_00745 [Flavobacteriaceae bacterium]